MATAICVICNRELEKCTKNFAKYSTKNNNIEPGLSWHSICKECEQKIKHDENWKDGLLKCHVCGEYFPEETFHKIGHNDKKYHYRNNRDNRCPKCKNNQNKQTRAALNDNDRLLRVLNMRFLGAKDRATRNGLDFNITKKFIIDKWKEQGGRCALTNIEMTFDLDNGRVNTNVSIDRIDSRFGYTTDNVQLICMAANQMKSDLTKEELIYFCNKIILWNNKKNKTD